MAYKAKYDYLNNEEELRREIEEHKKIGSISEDEKVDKPRCSV